MRTGGRKILWGFAAAAIIFAAAGGYFFLRYSGEYLSALCLRAAQTAEKEGKEARAAWLYEEAVEKDPNSGQARIAFAELYARMGNTIRAEEQFKACLELPGDTTDAYTQLARFYVTQGRLEEAVTLLAGADNTVLAARIGTMRPASPKFTPEPGHYGSETTVKMRENEEGVICYFTLDGSFPTTESARWEQALTMPLGTTVIRAVTVSEDGMVSALTEAAYQIDDLSAEVRFKDETIEAMVRAQIGKYTGQVTVGEMRRISSLSNKTEEGRRIGGEIKSFSDLQYMKALETLDLSDLSGLPDLNGLSAVPSLTALRLANCGLSDGDVLPLKSCQHLETLDLSDNRLTELVAIAELSGLKKLSVRSNFITDMTPLLLLPALESLDLSENSIGSLETVGCLSTLETLQAAQCGLTSLKGVLGLTSLKVLDLSGNRLRDLEGLDKCQRLETLSAGDNLIGNLYPLSGLPVLQTADLRGNRIASLRPLSGIRSLRILNINENLVRDISPLEECENLEMIMAEGNPLEEGAAAAFSGVEIYVD